MRNISQALEDALASGSNRPAFKILAYDTKIDEIHAIVRGEATQTPLELTPYAADLNWSTEKFEFTLQDPGGVFNPDLGASKAYVADGALIRLIEGDERVPEIEWAVTFTGTIRGQVGWILDRSTMTLKSSVTVFNFANNQVFKRRTIVSNKYTVGDDIGFMLHDILTEFMGLAEDEIRIPKTIGFQFLHNVNQLVEVSPWDGISSILQTVAQTPFFDGEGKLSSYSRDLRRPVDRIFPDYVKIKNYEFPAKDFDAVNVIRVVFLGAQLKKIPGPYQLLGTASVTAGFFKLLQKVDCYWSDDHRQRAEGTHMERTESCNTTMVRIAFGFDLFEETYREVDQYHGRVTVKTSIYLPVLATLSIAEYLLCAAIPDWVATIGVLGSIGETIPVGRISQALSLINILLIMMCLGTGKYDIFGTPYDYAYPEMQTICKVDGLQYWEENEREIHNDFIGSHERADALAMIELTWEQSSARVRKLIVTNDLSLEEGDIVALPDARKFFIQKLSKKLIRGEVPLLSLEGFKILAA